MVRERTHVTCAIPVLCRIIDHILEKHLIYTSDTLKCRDFSLHSECACAIDKPVAKGIDIKRHKYGYVCL